MPDIAEWNAAASRLAGRRCSVKFGPVYYAGAAGAAWLAADGTGVIEIASNLPFAEALRVLCHEAAHIRAGDAPMLTSGPPKVAYHPAVHAHLTVGRKAIEQAADLQASEWQQYAQAHARDEIGQLKALAGWIEPRYQRMIEKAAQEAAAKALGRVPR